MIEQEDESQLTIQLEVGEVSDSVSVTADASLVDSRSSTVGALIDSRRVTELPTEYLLVGQYGASASKQIIGWAIDATRDPARLNRQAVFLPPQPFGFALGTVLTIKLKHLGLGLGQGIGRFRLSLTSCDDPRRVVSVPAQLRRVLDTPPEQRTGKQTKDLAEQCRRRSTRRSARASPHMSWLTGCRRARTHGHLRRAAASS